jgi:PKD repeat protein
MYTVGAGAITEYSETGQELATIPISGTQPGDECLAVTNTGGFVVTNDQHNTVSEYESNGAARASWSAFYAQGVAVGSRGQVFVGVGNGAAVEEFSESGVLEGRVPLRPPTAGFYTNYNKLALAPSGLLYSTDPRSNVIWRLDTTPHAEITASPAAGLASQQVTFDASGSSLDIGSIADYRWDLDGSGAYATDTGATATVSHRFDTPGTYAIGVQVTASDGETVQGALSYTVGGSSASFISSPSPGLSGQAVTFDASPSQIPNSSITDYAWDFDGSGSYSTDSGTSPTVSHAFSTSGTYTVQLKVTRAGGRIDTASGTIEIRPVPPVGAVGVSVNDGDYATNTTAVQLYVVWPVLASGALVSNDGGFGAAGGTTTLPLASTIPWTLRSEGSERLPKTVYVRFPDSGNPTQTFTDDIILDTTTPVVQSASSTGSATTASVAAAHRRSGRVFRIRIHATEKLSGVSAAQFSTTRSGGTTVVFTDRTHQGIQRFVRVVKVSMAKRPRYVRVRSAAGNWSKWHRIGG